jgi:hypothetical protein
MTLTKAEEGQNRQNHNNQTNKINKTVHGFLLMSRPFFLIDNRPQLAKFLQLAGKSGNRRSARAVSCLCAYTKRHHAKPDLNNLGGLCHEGD